MHSRSCFQNTTLGLQGRQQPAQGTEHVQKSITERDGGSGGGGEGIRPNRPSLSSDAAAHNVPVASTVPLDSSVADVFNAVGVPWVLAVVMVSAAVEYCRPQRPCCTYRLRIAPTAVGVPSEIGFSSVSDVPGAVGIPAVVVVPFVAGIPAVVDILSVNDVSTCFCTPAVGVL